MNDRDFDREIRARLGGRDEPPPFREAETWRAIRDTLTDPDDLNDGRDRAGVAAGAVRVPRWLAAAALVGAFGLGAAISPLVLGRADRENPDAGSVDPGAEVQRAGSAFVRAIGALGGTPDAAVVDDGRQVALAAIEGAAAELRRLAPGDSLPLAPPTPVNVIRF